MRRLSLDSVGVFTCQLDQLLAVALRSSTIEWAVNVQICDMVKENQFLAPRAMNRIEERLRKDSPTAVQLALSLLEMLVKNCGMLACRAINPTVAETLVGIVKKRASWRWPQGREDDEDQVGWYTKKKYDVI